MTLPALPRVSNMKADEIFEELRTRLYDLGEARSHVLLNSASDRHQLSLFSGLRISDMIVELLRYKWYDGKEPSLRQDDWKARRDDLVEVLRMPWSLCASNSNGPNCPGGSTGCEWCRYSILSVAGQLNTLALGFAGTAFVPKDEGRGLQDQEKDREAAGERGEDTANLDSIKQELASARSELSEAQKTIEQLQKDNASTASDHKKDKEFLEKLKKVYDSMTEKVKECTKLLKSFKGSSTVWEVASKQCEALNDMVNFQLDEGLAMENIGEKDSAERRRMLKQEARGYQHQHVQALMKIDKHSKAEKMAKEVLDQSRRHSGKDASETQAIFKDYCEILTKVGKVQGAEFEYLQIWYDQDLESHDFRDEAGMSLAQLKQRHDEVEEAALWYRKVAARRLARLDVDRAAQVTLKMVSAQKQLRLSPESAEMLKKIWAKADDQPTPAVLSCGQELGFFLVSVGKYGEAKAVLAAVWRGLEKYGDEYLDKRTRVALSLAAIVPELVDGDDSDLQDLYEWISDRAKSKVDKKLSLKFQYQLGCLQLSRGDSEGAEKTLKTAWQEAKGAEGLGPSDELTIDIGCEYGQAILANGRREADAKAVFEELWKALDTAKKIKAVRTARPHIVSVLTTARHYAELLLEEAEACETEEKQKAGYKTAKKVLESAWKVAWPGRDKLVADRNLASLVDLLWTGDTYGECLVYLGRPDEAVGVLTDVLEWRKIWNSDAAEINITSGLLKDARDADARLKKAANPGPKDKPPGPKEKPPGGAGTTPDVSAGSDNLRPLPVAGLTGQRERGKSPAPQPKPKPPKARKQPNTTRLLRFLVS